ncbi:MAG: DeoR family transcriptional regulator [Candidatus Pacebacteria bacterium]|nr:DeoR family transcriptional regulator [Candidatus Paceibacterota bacterium]
MKSMDILERIFGSSSKVKIMRLFLFNEDEVFNLKQVSTRTKVQKDTARKDLNRLEKIGLIKRRSVKKRPAWILNTKFIYIKPLREFLVEMGPLKHSDVVGRLKNAGQVKLVILSGVFIHDPESRVDLLVVGDKLDKRSTEGAIRGMEAEIGKELKYALFDADEFEYRLGMYDKLLRDILDYPHQKVVNKFGDLN